MNPESLDKKIGLVLLLGIVAAAVSLIVNFPRGSITTGVLFAITGILPIIVDALLLFRRGEPGSTLVAGTWTSMIMGLTALTVSLAPSMNPGAFGTIGNIIICLVFFAGAALGFYTGFSGKIDMVP